jgi:hypothetical protein
MGRRDREAVDRRRPARDRALRRGDAGFESAVRIWNAMVAKKPAVVVQAVGVADRGHHPDLEGQVQQNGHVRTQILRGEGVQAAELLQTRDRLTPEHRRVDDEDLVEWLVEGGQVLGNGAEPQVDHSAPDALGVEPLRPLHHQLGVVDPAHVPLPREAAKLPYRDARSKADLQHAILRPHVEQGHRPRVPPAVRRAVGHEQARCAPPEAGWAPELGADTEEVLSQAGYDEDERRRLRAAGII